MCPSPGGDLSGLGCGLSSGLLKQSLFRNHWMSLRKKCRQNAHFSHHCPQQMLFNGGDAPGCWKESSQVRGPSGRPGWLRRAWLLAWLLTWQVEGRASLQPRSDVCDLHTHLFPQPPSKQHLGGHLSAGAASPLGCSRRRTGKKLSVWPGPLRRASH